MMGLLVSASGTPSLAVLSSLGLTLALRAKSPWPRVGAVGDALEFFQAVRKAVEDVHGGLGVVRELLGRLLLGAQVVAVQTLLTPPG
jgi:hypothetical protein